MTALAQQKPAAETPVVPVPAKAPAYFAYFAKPVSKGQTSPALLIGEAAALDDGKSFVLQLFVDSPNCGPVILRPPKNMAAPDQQKHISETIKVGAINKTSALSAYYMKPTPKGQPTLLIHIGDVTTLDDGESLILNRFLLCPIGGSILIRPPLEPNQTDGTVAK